MVTTSNRLERLRNFLEEEIRSGNHNSDYTEDLKLSIVKLEEMKFHYDP